jgi:hypothetical protein
MTRESYLKPGLRKEFTIRHFGLRFRLYLHPSRIKGIQTLPQEEGRLHPLVHLLFYRPCVLRSRKNERRCRRGPRCCLHDAAITASHKRCEERLQSATPVPRSLQCMESSARRQGKQREILSMYHRSIFSHVGHGAAAVCARAAQR